MKGAESKPPLPDWLDDHPSKEAAKRVDVHGDPDGPDFISGLGVSTSAGSGGAGTGACSSTDIPS
eukprot:7465216-Alexandrium_andersonii.AAC.1